MNRLLGRLVTRSRACGVGAVTAMGVVATWRPDQYSISCEAPKQQTSWRPKLGLSAEATNTDPTIPRGRTIQINDWRCSVYPGTKRKVAIHLPARSATLMAPMSVMIFLDGMNYLEKGKLDRVVEALSHRREMKPTALVFLDPGKPLDATDDYNQFADYFSSSRNFEYDSVSPQFAQFLEEDVLPMVQGQLGGAPLSNDPKERCIVGISSGGIAAMCAAWYRPDLIGRVIAIVPSFTNLAVNTKYDYPGSRAIGGHELPYMVRMADRRPLRIWLQSGSDDMTNAHGDWAAAFWVMIRALEFKGYDFKYVFEDGLAHNNDYFFHHAPEILRWVLRDEP